MILAAALKEHLTGRLLPFWLSHMDRERGGWQGLVDADLRVHPDAHKGCILHSRILWTFATAYRLTGQEAYREAAQHAMTFLDLFADDARGGVYWSVTADGMPLDTTKHTYCQAFAVYALSAWVRATGDQAALEKAMRLFEVIEGPCSDAGGYGEAFDADFSPAGNERLSDNPRLMEKGQTAQRTMNTLLHVLEAWAELYRAGGNERVRQAGVKCLERFLHTMYNPDKRRLEVFFDKEYRSLLDMQSYGHDIEASWLIWDAAETLLPAEKRGPYRDMCLTLAQAVYERAYTDIGVDNEIAEGEADRTRVWWIQAEALLGFDNAFRLTGDDRYSRAAQHQWEVIGRFLLDDRAGGEWFGYTTPEGDVIPKPVVDDWKCPYHNGRMCMRLMEKEAAI